MEGQTMYKLTLNMLLLLLTLSFVEVSKAQSEYESYEDYYDYREEEGGGSGNYDDATGSDDITDQDGDYFGSDNMPTYVCAECGDPADDPEDYRNFAANTARFGQFDDFNDIDQFIIMNLNGDHVIADIDWNFRRFGFEGFSLPVWPAWTYEITLVLPNGDMLKYTMHRQHGLLPVPYPDEETTSDNSGEGYGEEESEDEEEYYDEEDDNDWDYWEDDDGPEGIVTIEDPDEDGNFDDFWEEEEL
jgi:hypothetical protein